MEGSRPPGRAGGATHSGLCTDGATLLDEICLDHSRLNEQRIVLRPEKKIGEKLGEVIAGEVLPRLMLLHARRSPSVGATGQLRAEDLSAQVADFAELVIRHDSVVVEAYVKSLLHRGLDLETLLLHLLAPAARRLGALWEADQIDFVDVTIGTARLQRLLHRFTFVLKKTDDAPDRQILLVAAPEEQHTFGLVMVSEFFRREGWQVYGGVAMEPRELFTLIAEKSFALIGFSLSCECLIEPLCSAIAAVRRSSKNPSALVMVGGRIFAQDPSLRPRVGADLVAADARKALELAEAAIRKSAPRRGSHL